MKTVSQKLPLSIYIVLIAAFAANIVATYLIIRYSI